MRSSSARTFLVLGAEPVPLPGERVALSGQHLDLGAEIGDAGVERLEPAVRGCELVARRGLLHEVAGQHPALDAVRGANARVSGGGVRLKHFEPRPARHHPDNGVLRRRAGTQGHFEPIGHDSGFARPPRKRPGPASTGGSVCQSWGKRGLCQFREGKHHTGSRGPAILQSSRSTIRGRVPCGRPVNLTRPALGNPVAVIVAVLLVVLFGGISLLRMPVQMIPNVERPLIEISTAVAGRRARGGRGGDRRAAGGRLAGPPGP
jgi:hypothetical protein